ncbi:unnamed protein product [Blepharisma stoltei]|uniref:Uncharacterized protein n=1 Tax=Blepharisma stoltei TaxID=1481888 RepID=A0AAU9K4Q2_9CILI|nr:unnamed protein product [Blepharisma stoltei]
MQRKRSLIWKSAICERHRNPRTKAETSWSWIFTRNRWFFQKWNFPWKASAVPYTSTFSKLLHFSHFIYPKYYSKKKIWLKLWKWSIHTNIFERWFEAKYRWFIKNPRYFIWRKLKKWAEKTIWRKNKSAKRRLQRIT